MFAGQIVCVALSLVAARIAHSQHWSLSSLLLSGLLYYELPENETKQNEGSQQSRRKQATSRSKRRLLSFDRSERILQIQLRTESILDYPFYSYYDKCVVLMTMAIVHGIASMIPIEVFRISPSIAKPVIAVVITGILLALFKIEMTVIYSGKTERWISYVLCLIGAIGSFCLLTLAPRTMFVFSLDTTSTGVDDISSKQSQASSLTELTAVLSSYCVVESVLSVIGGLVSSVCLQAVVRAARSSKLMTTEYPELQISLGCPKWFAAVRKLQNLCLVVNCVVWIRPLLSVFEMPMNVLVIVQVLSCCSVALCQAASFRSLVQGYLNTGLTSWFRAIHGNPDGLQSEQCKRQVTLAMAKSRVLLCKVALQSLLLVMIPGCVGIALGMAWIQNDSYLYAISGFVIWWMSIIWAFYSVMVTVLYRNGFLLEI